MADFVKDGRVIAATLEIERLAVLASPAPLGAPDLDYFDGIGELNVDDIRLILHDPVAARAKCESDRLDMLALTPGALFEYLNTFLTPVDAAVLLATWPNMVDSTRSGLAPARRWSLSAVPASHVAFGPSGGQIVGELAGAGVGRNGCRACEHLLA